MTDMELAEEIEQHKLHLGGYLTESQWDQIIAALRRGPERPPSGERVMVPREPTRETILAINAAYWWLEEQTEIIGQGRASVDEHARTLYRAMLSAAEASKEAK